MRCSGCGNEIPYWAGGVCYTCGRIRREQKRFGVHPSARKQTRPSSAEPPSPAPKPSGSGGGFTLPPWLVQTESFEPPGHCPICGQEVPQDKLEEHVELHKRLAMSRGRPRQLLQRTQPAVGKRSTPDSPVTPSAEIVPPGESPQVRRRGINRLLADIYGKKHFLSDILREAGFSQADITRIYEERLRIFLDELLAVWRIAFAGELAAGAWHVLTRSYGLDGIPFAPIERLAQELAISQQGVSEIHIQTLKVLRAPTSRSHLENLTIVVARQQLRRL